MLTPDIRSLQAGDSRAWEAAYYWLGPKAAYAVKRLLRGRFSTDVDDVVVEAIKQVAHEVTKGLKHFGSFEELIAFTVVVADRRAKDHIRRMDAERRSARATETMEGREDLVSAEPSPVEEADAQEVARLLMDLMRAYVGEPGAVLLWDYYVEGLTQEELAERHKKHLGTIGVTLSRALKKFRKEIEKHPKLMKELREVLR